MDILDDWQRGQTQVPPPDGGIRADEEAFEVLDAEQPIFAIERVDRQISRHTPCSTCCLRCQAAAAAEPCPAVTALLSGHSLRHCCRGRGQVAAVAAANDCVVVATSRAYVLRYDLSEGLAPGTQHASLPKTAVTRELPARTS